MSDLKVLNYNINDIFERKIEVGAVIQFSLLQSLIEEFIKRQKAMNDKINHLEYKIAMQSQKETVIYREIKNREGEGDDQKKTETEKESSMIDDRGNEKKEEINFEVEEVKRFEEEGRNKEIKNRQIFDEEKDGSDLESKIRNTDLFKKISQRIENLELTNKDMCRKLALNDLDFKSNLEHYKDNSSDKSKSIDDKFAAIARKINEMDRQLKEVISNQKFNIGELDQNSENTNLLDKIMKKLDLLEGKSKISDEELFKFSKTFEKIKNESEAAYKFSTTHQEGYHNFSKDVNANFAEIKNKHEEDFNKLKELIKENNNNLKNELYKHSNEENKKISDLLTEVSALPKTKNEPQVRSNVSNEKINNLSNEMKNFVNKSISDTEKYIKSIINNLNIDKIRGDIADIIQELKTKLVRADLGDLGLKVENLDTKIFDLEQKLIESKNDINLCNENCRKAIKMVEYLGGQVIQTYQPDMEKSKKEEITNNGKTDMSCYVTKDIFEVEVNKIYQKIEKTLEIESKNFKVIEQIEEKLKFYASENDLRNMESCLMNALDEFKLLVSKKYLEKNEAQKNFKLFDLQIKHILENYSPVKEGDNWLIAKKPLNNFLCASCESYLGELKNKSVYLPWNRIPSREDKKYRMGHGFSRMLQLVNLDLLKNAEKISNKDLSIKVDEKKSVQDAIKELPIIGSQTSVRNLNKSNTTFSLFQNESVDHLNNSADNAEEMVAASGYAGGIPPGGEDSNLNSNERERNSSMNNYNNINDKQPKVMKIMKKKRK